MPHVFRQVINLDQKNREFIWDTLATTDDDGAHQFEVGLCDAGKRINLANATVQMIVRRADGNDRVISGSVKDNYAVAALDKHCYTPAGQIRCTMLISVNGAVLTGVRAYLDVAEGLGNSIVDPEGQIPSLAELLLEIQTLRDVTQRAKDVITHIPYIDATTLHWMVWDGEATQYKDTGIKAQGQDFRILGVYATGAALAAEVNSPQQGDHYNVGPDENGQYELYMYDVRSGWINKGVAVIGGGGSGDGTVKSFNGIEPDAAGDLKVNLQDMTFDDSDDEQVEESHVLMVFADEATRAKTAESAENAQKFGGNTPSYFATAESVEQLREKNAAQDETLTQLNQAMVNYRTAVNLLVNSYFRNPVEQAGRNGLHGAKKYAIDRWMTESGADAYGQPGSDLAVVSDGTNWVTGISQHVDTKLFSRNKVYTFAVYGRINNPCRLMVYNGGDYFGVKYFDGNDAWETYIVTFTIPDTFTADYVRCVISTDTETTGNTAYLRWAAIYEGAYTAETLPPYTCKDYAAELAECQRRFHVYETESARPAKPLDCCPPMELAPGMTNLTQGTVEVDGKTLYFNSTDL